MRSDLFVHNFFSLATSTSAGPGSWPADSDRGGTGSIIGWFVWEI